MNPTEFQKWLYGNFPPGVESWVFSGSGQIDLTFTNGTHLVVRIKEDVS